jgi:hypothetical protein
MLAVYRVADRIGPHEHLAIVPVIVIALTEQDADLQVDVDEIGGDLLAVDDDARGH